MDYRATIQLIVLILCPLLGRAQFGMDIGDPALLVASSVESGIVCSGSFASGDTERFESSEGSFCTTGWTEIDDSSILSTYSTSDFITGDHCLEYVDGGFDDPQTYIRADLGSGQSTIHLMFYFKGGTIGTNGNTVEVAHLNDSTTGTSGAEMAVRYAQYAGSHQLTVLAATNATAINISAGTWYRVEVDHIAGDAASYFKLFTVGGSQVGGTQTYHPSGTSPRYVFLGMGQNNYIPTDDFYLRFDNAKTALTSGDIGADE